MAMDDEDADLNTLFTLLELQEDVSKKVQQVNEKLKRLSTVCLQSSVSLLYYNLILTHCVTQYLRAHVGTGTKLQFVKPFDHTHFKT